MVITVNCMERNNSRSLWPSLLQFSSISIPSQFIQHFALRRLELFIPPLCETKQCFLNVRSNLCLLDRASSWWLKNKRPTWCHLLFYFTSYVVNMFRTLIYPSSGACDYSVELPHWSYYSWFDICWSFGVFGLEWYPCCRLKPCIIVMVEE